QTLTCSQAYNELSVMTSSALTSYGFQEALTKELDPDAANNPGGLNANNNINQALQNLGISNTDAQKYMQSAILAPIYEQAVIGRYQDMQDFSSAIALNQALQQRNTQWASEQSMFMTTVRPLQTFFEGFVYGITPILAMLIVTGSFGFSMAGKYLQLLFWVQLWLPLLSIINLYIMSSAAGEIQTYDDPNITSMYALEGLSESVQHWVSIGGMLAAAVPMIALFVVTGSTYAFAQIAGRIQGQDHFNEKINTPDVAQPAPLMKQDAYHTNNPISGTMATGSESIVGSTSLGAAMKEASASTAQQAQEASTRFG